MKKSFAFLMLWVCLAGSLQAGSLQSFVEEKQQLPVLQGALWGGIAAYTDAAQAPLFALHEYLRLTPASTLKLLTTAAALQTLGPDFRFQTHLYASQAPDANGIVHGDLYIQGAADPTLGSARVTGAEKWQTVIDKWVSAIQKAGIKKIEGTLYADVSLFEGPSVSPKVNWENMGNYFAAPVSPLCFNDNSFEIHFAPQILPNHPARVAYTVPEIPGLQLKSFVITDGKSQKDNAYVYAAPQQYELKIFGTIPTSLKGFSIQAALPDPALFTVQTLQQALSDKGISVSNPASAVSAFLISIFTGNASHKSGLSLPAEPEVFSITDTHRL